MSRKKVPCFKTQKLPPGKFAEMDRQLAAQQNGLNKMTVQDYLDGRARYAADGRKGAAIAALQARNEYRAVTTRRLIDAYRKAGHDVVEAENRAVAKVADYMASLDALHAPDMVAGGKSGAIAGLGDAQVNRTIGRQWNKGSFEAMTRVKHMDDAALAVPAEKRGGTLMNVDMHRCK